MYNRLYNPLENNAKTGVGEMRNTLKIYGKLFRLGFYKSIVLIMLFPLIYTAAFFILNIIDSKSFDSLIYALLNNSFIIIGMLLFPLLLEQIGNKRYQFLISLPIKPKDILSLLYINLFILNILSTIIIMTYDGFNSGFDFTMFQIIFLLMRLIISLLFVTSMITPEMKEVVIQSKDMNTAFMVIYIAVYIAALISKFIFISIVDSNLSFHNQSDYHYLLFSIPIVIILSAVTICIVPVTFKKALIKLKG